VETYLVEHYRPGLTVEELRHTAARVRTAAGAMEHEGTAVRYLRTAIVPTDEAFLSVFEAESEEDVRRAYTRAGVVFERISLVIGDAD
jgi:hypothetical protein